MMYNFKLTPELIWAVVVTLVGVISTVVANQGTTPPTDWKVWAAALAAGVLRAIVGLILDKANVSVTTTPPVEPPPDAV